VKSPKRKTLKTKKRKRREQKHQHPVHGLGQRGGAQMALRAEAIAVDASYHGVKCVLSAWTR